MSLAGSRFGHIRLEQRLGVGGMGEVYLGFDEALERLVAVKLLVGADRLGPHARARFQREARLLSRLGHPGICRIHELIETPQGDALVLEHVPGMTLRAAMAAMAARAAGVGAFARRLDIAGQVARALAAAHREGIVHRDLKPENVMVTPEGVVKILDFGIARLVPRQDDLDLDGISQIGGERISEAAVGNADFQSQAPIADGSTLAAQLGETLVAFPAARSARPPLSADRPDPVGLANAASTVAAEPSRREPEVFSAKDFRSEDAALTQAGAVIGTLAAMSPEQAAGGRVSEASDLYSLGILLHELFTDRPAYQATNLRDLRGQVLAGATASLSGLDPELAALIRELESLDPSRRPGAELVAARLAELANKPERERARRRRRQLLIAAFVVLGLGLAVVSWLALAAARARDQAERRRKQAEELIGFMLGDLHPRLEQVGRLELLEAVAERAEGYFAELPERELSPAELAHRVRAFVQVGQLRRAQGDLDAAAAAFGHARDLAVEASSERPDDGAVADQLFSATQWAGQVEYDRGDAVAALAAADGLVDLATVWRGREPTSRAWQARLAQAWHDRGTVRELLGDLGGAVVALETSLAQQQALPNRDNDELGLEAATLSFLSRLRERQGDLARARSERERFVAVEQARLALAPDDAQRRYDVAVAQGFLAGLLAITGQLAAAQTAYLEGLETIDVLAAADPENAELVRWQGAFRSALAGVEGDLARDGGGGRAAIDLAARDRALGRLREGCSLFVSLLGRDPANLDWRLQLAVCRLREARLQTAELDQVGLFDGRSSAEPALTEARRLLVEVIAGSPDQALRGYLAELELLTARIAFARHDPPAAAAALAAAAAVLEPCPRPLLHWRLLVSWVEVLARSGRPLEARQELVRLEATGYLGPELGRLRQLVAVDDRAEPAPGNPS